MRTLRQIMTKKVVCMLEDELALTASKKMCSKKISCIVIVNDKKDKIPLGIITERDITYKVAAKNKKSSDVKLKSIMTSPVVTVDHDTDFLWATSLLKKKKIRRLIVTEKDKLVGIVTQTDLLKTTTDFINKMSDEIKDVLDKVK